MKSDNIFRFLVLRPPSKGRSISGLFGPRDVISEVQDMILHAAEGVLPAEEARRRIGAKIVNSERYFRAVIPTLPLAGHIQRLGELLQQHMIQPDAQAFAVSLKPLLGRSPDEATAVVVASESYRIIKRTLWLSYCGLLLNPAMHPQDREIVANWLRALHLLESDMMEFDDRAREVFRHRPSVPYKWFGSLRNTAPPAPTTPPQPPEPSPEQEMRRQIKTLQHARTEMEELFFQKSRGRPKLQAPASESAGTSERQPVTVSWGPLEDPSRANATDRKEHASAFAAAFAAGVSPAMDSLPEIVNELDVIIGDLTADLYATGRRQEIKLAGNAFVQVEQRPFVGKPETGGDG